jgi:HPt (histidine-containing phosphotransfer) domain-containing protein
MNKGGNEMQYRKSNETVSHTLMGRFIGILSQVTGKQTASPPYAADTSDLEGSTHETSEFSASTGLSDRLASEMLALLLLELPDHRHTLMTTFMEKQYEALASHTHRLLGAVSYCNLPELAMALEELQKTTKSGDTNTIGLSHSKVILGIDALLVKSGYHEM